MPADDARFLAARARSSWRSGSPSGAWKSLASGQGRLRRRAASSRGWRRAVWFHAEAPQIGDALMDLAPRSLLVGARHQRSTWSRRRRSRRCSAATAGSAASPPERTADRRRTTTTSRSSTASRWRALAAKRRGGGRPALGRRCRGDYLAYDYQRGLLADPPAGRPAGRAARPRRPSDGTRGRSCSAAPCGAPAREEPAAGRRLAIALGGVQRRTHLPRTGRTWRRALRAAGVRRFALLGSDNGTRAWRAR